MEKLKIAFEMFKNEHGRWATWTLFFFGSILSVFTAYGQIKINNLLWLPISISAFLSICWIFVCLSIRKSTQTWRKVIIEIENKIESNSYSNENINIIKIFDQKKKEFKTGKDIWETIRFKRNSEGDCTINSVTRILTLQGIVFFIMFLFLLLFIA